MYACRHTVHGNDVFFFKSIYCCPKIREETGNYHVRDIAKKNLMQNKQSKNVIYLLGHRVKDAFNGFGVKHRHDLALNEALH